MITGLDIHLSGSEAQLLDSLERLQGYDKGDILRRALVFYAAQHLRVNVAVQEKENIPQGGDDDYIYSFANNLAVRSMVEVYGALSRIATEDLLDSYGLPKRRVDNLQRLFCPDDSAKVGKEVAR